MTILPLLVFNYRPYLDNTPPRLICLLHLFLLELEDDGPAMICLAPQYYSHVSYVEIDFEHHMRGAVPLSELVCINRFNKTSQLVWYCQR